MSMAIISKGKICNCQQNKGYLSLHNIESSDDPVILPLKEHNKVWYHDNTETNKVQNNDKNIPTINKLSHVAMFEL